MGIKKVMKAGVLALSVAITGQSFADWSPYPTSLFKPDLSGDNLSSQWSVLTRSTLDPLPSADNFQQRISTNKLYRDYLLAQLKASAAKPDSTMQGSLEKSSLETLASELQQGWRLHFEGNFSQAKEKGLAIGTSDGKYLAYRAQTIYAVYMSPAPTGDLKLAERTVLLKDAADSLREEISAMAKAGVEPSVQLKFWQTYAYARYVEIVKPTFVGITGTMDKKKAVTTILISLDSVFAQEPAMPAMHAVYGGSFAAIYEDGMAARATFKKRLRLGSGQKASDYETAVLDQFDSAINTLGNKPFPQLYFSYGEALDRLDKKRGDNRYKGDATKYYHYAQGGSFPKDVTGMVYSAEDALAQRAATEKKL